MKERVDDQIGILESSTNRRSVRLNGPPPTTINSLKRVSIVLGTNTDEEEECFEIFTNKKMNRIPRQFGLPIEILEASENY